MLDFDNTNCILKSNYSNELLTSVKSRYVKIHVFYLINVRTKITYTKLIIEQSVYVDIQMSSTKPILLGNIKFYCRLDYYYY